MKKVINDKKELDRILNEFIGTGKVQSLSLTPYNDGEYEWKYRENGIAKSIVSDDRNELEKLHMEFGGKNPETCRAPDSFLKIDFNWGYKDVLDLGHRITKVKLLGTKKIKHREIPILLDDGCGSSDIIKSRKTTKDEISFHEREVHYVQFTRSFSDPKEFDCLLSFMNKNPLLKVLTWYVSILGTESNANHSHCVWEREKAGDGTKRMVLLLSDLNGKHYTECMRKDLYDAADEMFFAPCERLTTKKKKEVFSTLCFLAAEDGLVDISGMEA